MPGKRKQKEHGGWGTARELRWGQAQLGRGASYIRGPACMPGTSSTCFYHSGLGSWSFSCCACWWCLLVSWGQDAWLGGEGGMRVGPLYFFPRLSGCSDPHCPGTSVPQPFCFPQEAISSFLSLRTMALARESQVTTLCDMLPECCEGQKLKAQTQKWVSSPPHPAPPCPFDRIITIIYVDTLYL